MNNLAQAIWVEMLKARRSRIPWLTTLGMALLPVVGGFFMIIVRDPDLARRIGLISAKAQLTVGGADWPSYFGFLAMGTAMGLLIVSGIVASWVFGREYADRTAKDLLALPTARSAVVLAKFVVVGLWAAALAALIYIVGLGVGAAVALPPAPAGVFWQGTITLAVSAVLTIALIPPIAFVASAGHGYLAPFGVLILLVAVAQIVAILGWGEFFPYAVPGLYSQGQALGPASPILVALTGLAGIGGTVLWWERADQAR